MKQGLRIALFVLFIACGSLSGVYAQNRSLLSVYLPQPTGGTQEQQDWFRDRFSMELVGASYPQAETKEESAFSLLLNITDNSDFDRSQPANSDNSRYLLFVSLINSANNQEVVKFDFGFNDLDSMANYTLDLLYQAMANAYAAPPPDPPPPPAAAPAAPVIDDRWRNKWLYMILGAGLDLGYLVRPETMFVEQGIVAPAFLVGAECQFLNFLSFELDVRAHFLHDREKYLFAPAAAATLRGVLKPSVLMLEIYAGAEYSKLVPDIEAPAPWLWVVGGLQFGFKAGTRSAVTLDISGGYSAEGTLPLSATGDLYSVFRVSLLGGVKIGFWDRKREEDQPQTPSSINISR